MTTPEKPSCSNCDYWRENAQLSQSGGIVASNDNGRAARPAGDCQLRQTMFLIPMPSKLDPRQATATFNPVHEIRFGDSICDRHPRIVEQTLKGAIAFAVGYWKEYLDYRPGKNKDEIAGGFSRMPTFAEVLARSVGGDQPPGAALSSESANPPKPEGTDKVNP